MTVSNQQIRQETIFTLTSKGIKKVDITKNNGLLKFKPAILYGAILGCGMVIHMQSDYTLENFQASKQDC
jgi:hypothetical protein